MQKVDRVSRVHSHDWGRPSMNHGGVSVIICPPRRALSLDDFALLGASGFFEAALGFLTDVNAICPYGSNA
jgi:hypothetical protein